MTLIKTVDCSSHNQRSLTMLAQWVAQGAQALIVHSYHSGEQASLAQTTREWISLARQAGIWAFPYVWLFRSMDPARQTREAIELFRDSDMPPSLIALDCETYGHGSSFDPGPTAEQILTAAETARGMGVEVILYSGLPWLTDMDGDHEILRGVPAWIANYNGQQTLDVPAPEWVRVIGHQYTSTPVDWSVFSLEALKELSVGQDPCSALKSAIATELETIDSAMAAMTDAVERVRRLVEAR